MVIHIFRFAVMLGLCAGVVSSALPPAAAHCSNKLVATPLARSGVGHAIMGLVAGIYMANLFNATLALHPNYWPVDEKKRPLNHSFGVGMKAYFPSLEYVQVAERAAVLEINKLAYVYNRSCEALIAAQFSGAKFCDHHYCVSQSGLYDRVSRLVPQVDRLPSLRQPENASYIDVYWHFRTGDIVPLFLHPESILHLRDTINSHFHQRTPRHYMITQNQTQASVVFEAKLKNTHFRGCNVSICPGTYSLPGFEMLSHLDMMEVLDALMGAEVIVSMGSSGSYLAPLLRSHKRMVHFYYPPKECYYKDNGAMRTDLYSASKIVSHVPYRAFFIRKGVVPVVGDKGLVFAQYEGKMALMLSYLDKGEDIPLELSMRHYESWPRLQYNASNSYKKCDEPPSADWNFTAATAAA